MAAPNKNPQMIIRPRETKRVLFYGATVLIALLLIGWLVFYWGFLQAGVDLEDITEERNSLVEQVKALTTESQGLNAKIAILERSQQVETEGYAQVKNSLSGLQAEILELREEIAFYRGIVSPGESSSGLRIERFILEHAAEERIFHYKLILTQVLKNDRLMRGYVNITVDGVQDGKPKQYSLKELAPDKTKPLQFTFRYFQKFEGDMLIPEGFTPRGIQVEVVPRTNKVIRSTYEWVDEGTGKAVKISEEII